jgi:dipeptidyl aminopeptidase/acylaminoacyl peptidase
LLAVPAALAQKPQTPPLQSVAEKSEFKATSRHVDVVEFCEQLKKLSPLVRLAELGKSGEGRSLPLVILADPPVSTPEEAAKSGKLVVFAMGNIHAGEVDGKEALMMLARDLATDKDRPLLKDLVILFAPIFNADGNEKISKDHRRSQAGPEEGVGVRENAAGLDLNRDYVKLESPEVRCLVRFFSRWDPAVFIDCHTTNGSFHRYTITYEGPTCPAGDANIISLVRDEMLPEVSRRLEKRSGYKSFFYGNFFPDHSHWRTVAAEPRYGTHYFGLRNRIGILSESYSYAPYRDRILASRDFVRSIFEYAAENREKLGKLLRQSRSAAPETIALRHKMTPLPRPVTVLGFEEERKDGKRVAGKPRDYPAQYWGVAEVTLSVRRPYAYLFPPSWTKVVENLQRHGLTVEELHEDIELDLEVYKIDKANKQEESWERLRLFKVDTTARPEARRMPAGTVVVRTAQPLGSLAAFLLEPQADDGLCTWGFFEEALTEGKDFPVVRLPAKTPLSLGAVRPLAEDRTFHKRIDYDMLIGKKPFPDLSGTVGGAGPARRFSPGSRLVTWEEDGEHFLQRKGSDTDRGRTRPGRGRGGAGPAGPPADEGEVVRVHARTGRVLPYTPPVDARKIAAALATLPALDNDTVRAVSRRAAQRLLDDKQKGDFFTHGDDLYYFTFDGSKAVRLTRSPGAKELTSLSPDGKYVAFVRNNNLFVVDVATQTERALTTDGSELISNGKMDWVYMEEIGNRQGRAYWWSPDSTRLAFVRYDDTPVPKYAVVDPGPVRQRVEVGPYPKPGDPNPVVRLGIVPVAGGPAAFVDLEGYSDGAVILTRAGWMPDGAKVYFYVQDRAQTWLDFCTASRSGGTPSRLFREKTQAWVDDPGDPHFLKDGSFLLPSERDGWKHFSHFDKDGKLLCPLTTGPWEARALHHVDEDGGWVYFSGTKDSPIASNLYRVKLDGSRLERLTEGEGDHRVILSPKANLFVDITSSHRSPPTVALYATDGKRQRTLNSNPVYALEEYDLGKLELVQIRTPDGFVLEGSLIKPPDFDPSRRYPVWFSTYGGPHAPVVHDNWADGRLNDHGLATLGFLVFHADPRSASGKGACSTWTAYRRLGVQELADVETAVRWLTEQPFADASRVGISGHSYGGFMTCYAMTHSKLFAAGIAGAPVTDWRNYDSIYTERYMNTPQENPDGYNRTSVVKAAANLHGRLLLIHGARDDNVHLQNTLQLVHALQRADRDFEVMVYPDSRHGIMGQHYRRLMIDFMRRTLQPNSQTH